MKDDYEKGYTHGMLVTVAGMVATVVILGIIILVAAWLQNGGL